MLKDGDHSPTQGVQGVIETAKRFAAAGVGGRELLHRVVSSCGTDVYWTAALLRKHGFPCSH